MEPKAVDIVAITCRQMTSNDLWVPEYKFNNADSKTYHWIKSWASSVHISPEDPPYCYSPISSLVFQVLVLQVVYIQKILHAVLVSLKFKAP